MLFHMAISLEFCGYNTGHENESIFVSVSVSRFAPVNRGTPEAKKKQKRTACFQEV